MGRVDNNLRVSACAAYAGVSRQRTRNLLHAGLPIGANADRAPGESRRYSLNDVRLLALADAVMRTGFDAPSAVRVLRDSAAEIRDVGLHDGLQIRRGGRPVATISLSDLAAAINARLNANLESKK